LDHHSRCRGEDCLDLAGTDTVVPAEPAALAAAVLTPVLAAARLAFLFKLLDSVFLPGWKLCGNPLRSMEFNNSLNNYTFLKKTKINKNKKWTNDKNCAGQQILHPLHLLPSLKKTKYRLTCHLSNESNEINT
jgi:hypothetical protein